MDQAEAEKVCGARGDRIIAACSLQVGHVTTMDDWHEAHSVITEQISTNTFETIITRIETTHWAPNVFELGDKEAGHRILNNKTHKEEE